MNIDRPKIVLLYQSLLGIYGDHGNAVVLTKRRRSFWKGV
jgi:CobQ-like glutamine amidotransferase family enzyme